MFNNAGISIYAFKPNALGPNNTDGEVEYALKAAKALGANSVTIELPTDPKQSQRLGDLASKHKVYIGYHAHLQATDTAWDAALAQSPYNSLNLDCGHYIAAGGPNTRAVVPTRVFVFCLMFLMCFFLNHIDCQGRLCFLIDRLKA